MVLNLDRVMRMTSLMTLLGSESVQSDEDDLIKDIANNVSAVEKTGPTIGKDWLAK